jgi:leukotriene-A4 hydrolase
MARQDPHSHADSEQPRARHLRLRLSVDFAARRIEGEAALELDAPSAGILDLDSKALEILQASTGGARTCHSRSGPTRRSAPGCD